MSIITPNGRTFGGEFEKVQARLVTIDLAIQRLLQNMTNLAMQMQFEAAVNVEAFKRLGVELDKVASDVSKAGAAEVTTEPSEVKVEPSLEIIKEDGLPEKW